MPPSQLNLEENILLLHKHYFIEEQYRACEWKSLHIFYVFRPARVFNLETKGNNSARQTRDITTKA